MNDSEILEKIHINIHAVRLIKGYKPSEFELRVSKLIVDKYKDHCDECREVSMRTPEAHKNFIEKLGGLFK